MKKSLLLLTLILGALLVPAVEAAPITGLTWRDSTKAADTLVFRHSLAANVVPTKSSAGTIDSFLVVSVGGSGVTLPAGVTLNKTTGAFTGTPTAIFTAANRSIRAYSGTDSVTRTVRVSAIGITSLAWRDSTKGVDTLVFRINTAGSFTETHLGGAVDSFAIIGTATLPAGVTLDKTTGAITGTPTGVFAAANRTIRAYAKAGTDSLTRTVRISAVGITSLAWRDSTKAADTLLFYRGSAANFTQTHFGGAVDSFVVVGATITLPAGITLNKTTGAFTGTPTAIFTAANRTIRAYAGGGIDSITRTVRISAVGLTSLTWKDSTKAADTLVFSRGVAANFTQTHFGGAVDSFVVVGATVTLPAGITLDKVTGAFTGTATANFAAANRTVRAYAGAGGDSLTRTVRISAVGITGLAWKDSTKPADTLNLSRSVAVNLVPTKNGGPVDSFVVVGTAVDLPAGLTLNKTTGAITGNITATWPTATNRTIRAYASAGTDSVTRTLRFTTYLVTSLAYRDSTKPADTLNYSTSSVVNVTPTYLGGTLNSFAVIGTALPAGLTLNAATGAITGTPTVTLAAATRTIRGYNTTNGDSISRNLRITVTAGATSNLRYTRDTATIAVGVPITNSPTFSGRTPVSYSVAPALPAGLTLNTVTGVITGKPTTVAAAGNFVVTATDTVGTPDTTTTRNLRLTVAATEGDYNTAWTQHKTLWVNTATTMAGVAITANATKVPLLVRLDATNFATGFAQVAPGGTDIRFTKSNNTAPLPFEIETWDSAGATAAIWVTVDTVYSNNGTQNFRMHWGRTGVLNASSGANAFDTANGFRAVYHFTGTSNAVNETDATANASVASNRSTVDVQNPAVIGRGRDFNGTNEHFRLAVAPANLFNFAANGNYTLSAWASANVSTADRVIISKHRNAYTLKINATGNYEFSEYNNTLGTVTGGTPATPWALQAATAPAVADTAWSHVVGVSQGATKRLYVNGALVATNPGTAVANFGTGSATTATLTDTLTIGRQADTVGGAGLWGGDLDEVRVDGVARSADYIALSYGSQRIGATLIAHAQPTSIRAGAAAGGKTLAYAASGQGMVFRIANDQGLKARLSLTDVGGRVIWSRTVSLSAGMNDILWDGRGANGMLVPSGVYAVQASLLDAGDRVVQVLRTMAPLAR